MFEYELPRERGRRPDLVVIAEARSSWLSSRDTRTHHRPQSTRPPTTPVTCRLSRGVTRPSRRRRPVPHVGFRSSDHYQGRDGRLRSGSCDRHWDEPRLLAEDPSHYSQSWLDSEYAPLPSLVAAARLIFEHEDLPHIRRAESAGIPETIEVLDRVAERAQSAGESHLVLVTGVPGAGKTLVGLQFVYESHFGRPAASRRSSCPGTGPLVKVLQHTLKSRVFVQDVLGFLRSYGGTRGALPASTSGCSMRRSAPSTPRWPGEAGRAISEPEDFLRLGERLDSWALMVGLIGEGQEINRGEEAGIAQWNDALGVMEKPWEVHCPPSLAAVFSNAPRPRSSSV